MSLADRLKAARRRAGLSQAEVARRANISQPTYQGLETGKHKSTTKLMDIAHALGVRPEELTGDHPPADIATLVPGGGVALREVPVVGTAQLGPEGYWVEEEYPVGHGPEAVAWPTKDVNAYALRVEGDSMAPRIRHGERVIIEPNVEAIPGDEVLVRTVEGRSMVKIFLYERDGRVYLESINREHPVLSFSREQIERFHFVAGIARRTLTR